MALFIGLETVYPPLPKELFISNGSQPELSIRFASFEVDLHSCELRKDGVRVHLHDQPFQVLAILLEHRGELVTREELRQALWQTGTFVDFENGLNSAINRLREALCDSAKTPKYIETVPRRGYRFIAPIDRPAKVSNSDPTSLPVDPPPRPQLLSHRRWLILGTGTLVLLAMIPLVAWHRLPESSVGVISRQLSPIPLVTFAGGSQWMPAFSPEGSRVAYVWETETGSNYLEVKQLGSDTRLRLTHKPAELPLAPAWSPDGQWIAFARTGPDDDRGIFVIPALGGRERKLRSLATWYVPHRIVSWSPDGRWIVFADEIRPSSSALSKIRRANAIYLISPETLETRQLTHPEPGDFGDSAPTFSPDGATIAFVRTKANSRDEIYTVPTQGGTPYKLVTDGIWTNGLTWTSDGKSIIFDRSFVGGFRLWRVSLQGGALHSLDLPISHANLMEPNVRHGRLAYESHESIQTVGRVELNRLHSELPIKLVASTQSEWDGRYSPDGEHIAFISNRTGFDELWMADSDGTNPVQLTHLRTPLGGLSWQPAGALIAVSTDSGQVFVVSHETQDSRLVFSGLPFTDEVPNIAFSRDGNSLYVLSEPGTAESYDLLKVPLGGGTPAKVLNGRLTNFVESMDGRTLFYSRADGIWKRPVAGGAEQLVAPATRVWDLASNSLYLLTDSSSIEKYSLAGKHLQTITKLGSFGVGFPMSVSPDGRSALLGYTERGTVEIDMVQNFNPETNK